MLDRDAMLHRDVVSFGPFRLLVGERLLEREGLPIALGGRAMDILIALIERAGEVVGRRELIARVWPAVTVDDGNLRVQMAMLRKALEDGKSGARYITNVPGRGYSFVAPIARDGRTEPVPITGATSSRAHGLPPPPLHMIGRSEMVATVNRELATCRLVTLTGPGGIGKTTVAAAVGHAQLAAFEEAVRFVDLATLNDPDLVPPAVAAALGLQVRSPDPTPQLIAFLQDKRMLLVLDGCEPMIETAARLAERIVRETCGVHVLATSREVLRVAGEQIHRVEPLASPPARTKLTATEVLDYPAVQLFVERVTASRYGFALEDADAPMVAEICQRLDGIALAIELVAGRVEAYGIQKTGELLNGQFRLLWQGRRTAVARHKTMSAAIDWSYGLLTDAERLVLRRLAAFAGPFELTAAQCVAAGDPIDEAGAIEILGKLVDKSLIALERSGRDTRYRLFDTTRAYLLPKLLESGEAHHAFERHAQYWRTFLEDANSNVTSLGEKGFAAYADHLSNLRAALDWSFSDYGDRQLGAALTAVAVPLFLELSLLSECCDWAQKALLALPDGARWSPQEMKLLAGLGLSSMVTRGNPHEVRVALTRGLDIATTLHDAYHQLRFLGALHLFLNRCGDFRGALSAAERSEGVAKDMADPAGAVIAESMLSVAHHLMGNMRMSQRYGEAALSRPPVSQRMHTVYLGVDHRNRALCVAARNLWLRGFADQAIETANFTIEETAVVEHPVSLGIALWTIPVFVWVGQWGRAEAIIQRLSAHAAKLSLHPYQAVASGLQGGVAIKRGDSRCGVPLLEASLSTARQTGYPMIITWFMNDLAEGLLRLGRAGEALAVLDQAVSRIEENGELFYMPELQRLRGESLLHLDRPDDAETALRAAIDWARRQDSIAWELRAAISLTQLRCQVGAANDAGDLLAGLYSRFSEGFGSVDVKAAAELLETLDRAHPANPPSQQWD
jgi:predicted ATPase/DNA-binding winged helix-turn-helix (wHTH) protein